MNIYKFLLLVLFCTTLFSNTIQLTPKEKNFIKKHPTIILGTGDSWKPYVIQNSDGSISGYDNDILTKINNLTGANFIQKPGNWTKIQKEAKDKQIDGLSTLIMTDERKKFLNFSDIYISLEKMAMVKQRNPLKIYSPADMDEKTIAIHKGNMADQKAAEQFKNSKIIYANTPKEMLEMVIFGKADVTLGNGATEYMLGTLGLPYMDNAFALDSSLDLRFAVRKDWPEAVSILNKALATISKHERVLLQKKWFALNSGNNKNHTKDIQFTAEEKEYILKNPTIKVAHETYSPPYSFGKDGVQKGFAIEYINILAKKINIKIDYIDVENTSELRETIKSGKVDVVPFASKTEQREKHFNFTQPYIRANKAIFSNDENIHSLDDLHNKTVSVVRNITSHKYLEKNYPNIKLDLQDNFLDIIKSVIDNRSDALIGEFAIINHLLMENSFKIDSTKLIDKIEFSKDLHIVTRKDLTILRDILNKAMDIVTEEELLSLKRKWFGSQLKIETKKQIDFLTLKDKKYLENKKEITMCIDPNWMPYEKFDNGKHMGMSADYFKVFEKNIGINIKPIITKSWSQSLEFAKNRKCDILSLAMETPERKKYLKFTKPYLSIPLVIATKIDVPFINDIASVKNQKIGIPKGYAFVEILKNKYPNLNIIEVKNINDGLEKVNKGELFAYIGTLASIGYKFQTKYTGELKIAGKFEDKWELGIGVRDDDKTLFNILNNTVKSLDAKKQQKILNDWISIKYEKGTDYTLIWEILIIVFVIVLFLIYRQYILKKTNKKLQITVDNKTKDLKILNANLEIKIAQEVEKNLAIQEKLFNSERLAAMGEMIGNISHQWRQPLSVISTASSGMQLQKEYGMLTDEIFNSSCEAINNNAQYLSKTIDDFKNFIKGDRTKEVFNLKDNIDSFLQLVEGTIKTHHINIILNLEENIKIDGYQNELIQCFINIFNNAKDVLNKIKDEDNRLFFISVDNDEKRVTIKFRDSGGGIPKEIIAKVFDPYFTTKHKSQGTGLGLNMSHKLITEGMDGSIEVKNVQYTHNNNEYTGAEFTIILPKS